MAIDTREERQSAQALLVPSFIPGVHPSTMDQAERQAAGWVYAGIQAVSPGGGHPAIRRLGGVTYARSYGVRGVKVFAPLETLNYAMAA